MTNACPLEPSLDGYVNEAIVAPGAVIACEKSNSSSDASHNSVASVEALTASCIVIPAPSAVLDVSPDP